jgi:hypothetical protein
MRQEIIANDLLGLVSWNILGRFQYALDINPPFRKTNGFFLLQSNKDTRFAVLIHDISPHDLDDRVKKSPLLVSAACVCHDCTWRDEKRRCLYKIEDVAKEHGIRTIFCHKGNYGYGGMFVGPRNPSWTIDLGLVTSSGREDDWVLS